MSRCHASNQRGNRQHDQLVPVGIILQPSHGAMRIRPRPKDQRRQRHAIRPSLVDRSGLCGESLDQPG